MERFEYRGVIGVFLLLGEVQAAGAVDFILRVEVHRNTIRNDLVDKLLARGLRLQIGVAAVNLVFVFHRQAIHGEQSLRPIAGTADLLDSTTLYRLLYRIITDDSGKVVIRCA